MKKISVPSILSLLFLIVALLCWNSCASLDSKRVLATATQDWAEGPIQIVKEYYDSLNVKDWDRALSYFENPNPSFVKTWKALTPTYEVLEIQRFSNFSATQEAKYPVWVGYEGDIEGKCISLYVKENVYYPSGWGAEPSGINSLAFILVENEGKWKIADWGFIGRDACTSRIKTLEVPQH